MKSHGKVFCLLMSVCFIAATASAAFAQTGKCGFQTLNIPAPATNGTVVALNDSGAIVGSYGDAQSVSHGFLLYQGRLTSFMFPGSTGTTVSDLSSNGIIIGDFSVAGDPRLHHYMVHSGGFHEITLPGFPNADFSVTGVNANGDVVGNIDSGTLPSNGYLLHNGKITLLLVPGSDVTLPTSINNEGVVVGGSLAQSVNSNPAFMWKDGVFSDINPPGGDAPPFVAAAKISNSGAVVGSFQAADTHGQGFAFKNGKYTNISVPGFSDSFILAVNKFDNVLIQGQQRTQQGFKIVLFKGFCGAAF